MVGDSNDSCTACFLVFEPRVKLDSCSHFDGMPFSWLLLRVEVDGVRNLGVLQAELAYKVLVAEWIHSARMEVQ